MARPKKQFNTKNESIDVVHDIGLRKRFSPHDLKAFRAITENQEEFLRLFYQQTPLISLHGSAGTGKTWLALAAALTEVFDSSSPFEKITIIRSAVEVRKIGFLPGSEEEKMAVYEAPYQSILKELMNFRDPYPMAKQLGYIEFAPTSYLRGMTFHDQIVIVDEAENMDYSELATICTRIGSNCKIILIGDDKQSDLERQRETSGFKRIRQVLDKMPADFVGKVEFTFDDIVRSELVKQFIIAESKV